jgi:3',5'-cyclic-AMP phosphodiesterase
MTLVAHISDLHVGAIAFQEDLLKKAINEINDMEVDVTVVTGDITENGYFLEFERAGWYLDNIESPLLVVPGNHDARHVGDQCFGEIMKNRYGTLNLKEKGIEVIGLDSSEPDLDYGKIGRAQQKWMENELQKAQKDGFYKIIALHHHIIPVPKTGRERNVLSDAGDILLSLIEGNANLVDHGRIYLCHCGNSFLLKAASQRVRFI